MSRGGFKINKGVFIRKISQELTPHLRRGLMEISTRKACAGVKGKLAVIMGVDNFGDPEHRFPNNADGVKAPIPARGWATNATHGKYAVNIGRYINKNLPALMASIPKRNAKGLKPTSNRALHPDDFINGLAQVLAQNERECWNNANFADNAEATIKNKGPGLKPLHGKSGKMSEDKISAWTEERFN